MKTPRKSAYTPRLTMLFAFLLFIISCQRSDKLQTFRDIFDTSGIDALNSKVVSAKTVADLPEEFRNVSFTVPSGIENISLSELIAWYSQNIQLTDTEVDLLLKNDSKTYLDVINRMANYPPQVGSLKADDFKALRNSDLKKYLLKQVEEPENFYSTDYYSAILALQEYLKCSVIEPLTSLSEITSKVEYTSSFTPVQYSTGCESAFACGSTGICFLADFNRWGWSNPVTPGTSYTMPLYAGAAKCDVVGMTPIGTVSVTYSSGAGAGPTATGGTVTVQYIMNSGYSMDEAHVYVGCGQYPANNGITVAPGQYPFNATNLGSSAGITVTFTGVTGCVYVIAHAVTCPTQGTGTKTFGPVAMNLACPQVCTPYPPAYILYYKIISLNNIWDMWWTYWSDGSRTKHKGAAGTFPG